MVVSKVYTPKQIAEILQVHWQTVLNYIKDGELKAFRLGKRGYRVEEKDLQKFIEKKKKKGI